MEDMVKGNPDYSEASNIRCIRGCSGREALDTDVIPILSVGKTLDDRSNQDKDRDSPDIYRGNAISTT